jgi:hypothetical protein
VQWNRAKIIYDTVVVVDGEEGGDIRDHTGALNAAPQLVVPAVEFSSPRF